MLSFLYNPTHTSIRGYWKTDSFDYMDFVGKVMSLLFNMLSRLVIAFLLRSRCLLISWLQSPSAVTLELPQIKSLSVSTVSPSICHEVMGPGRHSIFQITRRIDLTKSSLVLEEVVEVREKHKYHTWCRAPQL